MYQQYSTPHNISKFKNIERCKVVRLQYIVIKFKTYTYNYHSIVIKIKMIYMNYFYGQTVNGKLHIMLFTV